MTKSRGILPPRKRWTSDEVARLRRDYPDKAAQEIAADFGVKVHVVYRKAKILGLQKSMEFLASEKSGRMRTGSELGKATRFRKGAPSSRKGKPFPTRGRMGLTQFKKGHSPHNARFRVGDRRINSEGYLDRKVRSDLHGALNWEAEHRLVWKKAYGPIPDDHVVTFKPGRFTNEIDKITPDALELITRAENLSRISLHRFPKELVQVIQLKGAITRQINKRERDEKQDQ